MPSRSESVACLLLAGVVAGQASLGAIHPANTPPVIQSASTVELLGLDRTAVVAVTVGDAESPADQLVLTARAFPLLGEESTLIHNEDIRLGGTSANRTATFTVSPGMYGFSNLELTLQDPDGGVSTRLIAVRRAFFWPFDSIPDARPDARWIDINLDGLLDLASPTEWALNPGGTNRFSAPTPVPSAIPGFWTPSDVNRDGWIDFAVTGRRLGSLVTQVFTNRAGATAAESGFLPMSPALLPGTLAQTLSWSDFDADGDPDLLAMGTTNRTPVDGLFTAILENAGDGNLSVRDGGLPALVYGETSWADLDGDGDMDVGVLGRTQLFAVGGLFRIFLNDGTGHFQDSGKPLPRMDGSPMVWTEFNNDGRPDLLLNGIIPFGQFGSTNVAIALMQEENGSFSQIAQLPGLRGSKVVAADFDNDGRTDILHMGGRFVTGSEPTARLYLNRGNRFDRPPIVFPIVNIGGAIGDVDDDGDLDVFEGFLVFGNNSGVSNAAPAAPDGLSAVASADAVLFTWSPAFDREQTNGLSYNLRVGTRPGGIDVVSPMSDPVTGRRRVVQAGNASESLRWRLRGLRPGVYYWSVQAIDNAFAGGPFAGERQFTVEDPAAPRLRPLGLRPDGILDLEIEPGTGTTQVLEASADLLGWSEIQRFNQAGPLRLQVTNGPISARFFRLRRP